MEELSLVAADGAALAIGFRRITDEDLPFLRRVYGSARAAELAPVPWTDAQKQQFLDQQFALQHSHYTRHYPGAEFLLMSVGTEPIGRVYVCRSRVEIDLMEITLLPEWRSRGIGGAIIDRLVDESNATGIPIGLHVEAHNPAQHLYARKGFVRVEDRGVYQYLRREAGPSALN